jgi:hypothetical protein
MRVLFKVTANDATTYHTCPTENQNKLRELFEEFGATVEVYDYPVALEVLPEETQNEVKNTLKAFGEVTVTYQNRKFDVSAAISVTSHYAYDHMVCGRYLQENVYTREERRQNFLEEFGYVPCYLK